jgi:hypothetical protein
VTDALGWLHARLADAPDSLRASVLREVDIQPDGVPGDPSGGAPGFGGLLEAAAERLIASPRAAPTAPVAALALLTADALITLACEWAAEHGPASSHPPW